jgi:hypothetical protein
VLVGVENGAPLRQALGELPKLRVVDMERWLRGADREGSASKRS